MTHYLLIILFLGLPSVVPMLLAQESNRLAVDEALMINSGEAQYNEKEILLIGQVNVQHSLGNISAHRLSIQSSFENKKGKMNFFKINDDVQIELKEGGKLLCQRAEIDYDRLYGIFLGNNDSPDVTYLNSQEGKNNFEKLHPALVIKSRQMDLQLLREASSNTTLIKEIKATQHVRIHYDQNYLLLADYAIYQRIPSTEVVKPITGLLTLSTHHDLPNCQLTTLQGDRLQAQVIQVDTNKRQLWLTQSKGIFYLDQDKSPAQTLSFSAQEIMWKDTEQNLILKDRVELTQNESLYIRTNQEIIISQAILNGERTLRSISSPHQTEISYLDVQKGNTHKIKCPGHLFIDHEHQEIILQGLPIMSEQVIEERQVFLEDFLGEMYADYIKINYSWQERQFVPQKILLEGHVKLFNRFDGHLQESGSILHYALADRVEYFPSEQEINLVSFQGNRVLLLDKVNNIQMSAPSLKVKYDKTTHKESIQGIGDVRFTFMEREMEQFKKHFHVERASQ